MKVASHITAQKPSYIRQILEVIDESDCISLAGGLPSPKSFPLQIFNEALESMKSDASTFQYGKTSGYEPLRQQLVERYHIAKTHDVMITSGSQQGIDLCTRTFIETGDIIVVENPCYLGAIQSFSIARSLIKSVDQELDGPNLEQLESLFKDHRIGFFYGVPDFQNPTGVCWSIEKRMGVAALCAKHQVLFIEDAPYRGLRFYGDDLPTVSTYIPEQTIELRSLSKVLAPGLRVSALIAPHRYSSELLKVKQATDLHTTTLSQRLVYKAINDSRLNEHLLKVRGIYRNGYLALSNELNHLLPSVAEFNAVEGGMFIWLRLPGYDVVSIAKQALDNGVAVVPSSEFSVAGRSFEALRLNFSYNTAERIAEGVRRLVPFIN